MEGVIAEKVFYYRSLNLNWSQVAKELGISFSSIKRWRHLNDDYVDARAVCGDDELDHLSSQYLFGNPERGEVMLQG